MSVPDAAHSGSVRKSQFAIVPMWVHRRIIATRTRTIALAVYVELVGQYAGSTRDAEGLKVWPEVQQIADSMGVPKSSVERALKVLIDCGVVLKKRTVRRNQYWLPQEEPDAFVRTLAAFQSVTSDGPCQQPVTSDIPDPVQSVSSDAPGTVATDGLQSVTSDGPCKPDPSIQTQETLSPPLVPEPRAEPGLVGERETDAAPGKQNTTTTTTGIPPQHESQNPTAAAAGRIIAAYAATLGRPVLNGTKVKLESQAVELLAQGLPEPWLCDRARELAARGWSDLIQHAEHSTAPIGTPQAPSPRRPGLPPWCGQCGDGTGTAARLNPRFRKIGPDGARELCPHCHPDRATD